MEEKLNTQALLRAEAQLSEEKTRMLEEALAAEKAAQEAQAGTFERVAELEERLTGERQLLLEAGEALQKSKAASEMLQSQCTELRARLSAEEERAAAELREAERWQQICNDAQEEMEKLAQAQRLESEGLQKLLGAEQQTAQAALEAVQRRLEEKETEMQMKEAAAQHVQAGLQEQLENAQLSLVKLQDQSVEAQKTTGRQRESFVVERRSLEAPLSHPSHGFAP
ncbi:unnamed protein product [Effrenium voratum]|nr:unnamed protein product [Effrenium voratum]